MKKDLITRQAVMQVLRDYRNQYKKYPWLTVVSFIVPAVGTIFVFYVPPLIISKLVNLLASGQTITIGSASGYILAFGGLWLFGEALWRISMHTLTKLAGYSMADLSNIAFSRLTDRDYDFYTNNFVGSLTKKAGSFSRGFDQFNDTLVFNVVNNLFPVVFVFIVLWQYSPLIPLVLAVCLTLTVLVAIPIIRRRSQLVAIRTDAASVTTGHLSDSITNILAVKSFASENREAAIYGEHVDKYTQAYLKVGNFQNLKLDTVVSPLYVITNVFGLMMAIYFTKTLGLQAGALVIIFSYYSQVTRIFWEINRTYRNIESSISEAAEFTQLYINPPLVMNKQHAKKLTLDQAAIDFQNVEFKYVTKESKDKGKAFLSNFNLTIEPRQKVGLVGPSGGGKTTITKLILRFIDIRSGAIMIDGEDISAVTQQSLRENIAYVPQEPLLFHRSLFENIAYGKTNATRAEVKEAARLARADEFIDKLAHGYDTLVGERGIKLSGGQRQRIAIARAILKNAPILVLDEATSALDSESEKYIQEGLWELMKDKTALVIAHRLSTIRHLDRIVVLDDGKIVQDGTHDDLIKQKGLYATLWGHQSGEFLEDNK